MKTKKTKKRQPRTVTKSQAFLAAYEVTGQVAKAAKAAKISLRTHYDWLERYPEYAAKFKRSMKVAGSYIESECVKRATAGWLEPILYQGKVCAKVRRFDGGLAQFLLRGAMPEKYGARIEHSGPGGEPIKANITVTYVDPHTRDGS